MTGECTNQYYSQTSICIHVKGSSVNETASNSEVTKAIKYTTGATVNTYGKVPFSMFKFRIDNKKPVVFKMSWNSGGAHALVVAGYNAVYEKLRVVDPAVGKGIVWYYYEDLCEGTTIQSGTGEYTYTWAI